MFGWELDGGQKYVFWRDTVFWCPFLLSFKNLGIESARIQRYADYNAYKKARLVDVAKDIFTKMKTNEILEWVRWDASWEDIIKAAERVKYGFDWRITKNAIFVKWNENWAVELIGVLERWWWIYEDGGSALNVITYVSPDRKWKVNLRKVSSSEWEVEKAGYNLEAVIDVIKVAPSGSTESYKKIKFITLK